MKRSRLEFVAPARGSIRRSLAFAGGVSRLLWRELKATALVAQGPDQGEFAGPVSGRARAIAVASIIVWLAAITFGRLIAYVMDAAILAGH